MSKGGNFRIVVFSDTHGSMRSVLKIFRLNSTADAYIFLGDGEKEIKQIRELHPDKNILAVKGNCDFISTAPEELVFTAPDGRKIFAAHGNTYSVGTSRDRIFYKGKEVGACAVLFGHTHCRYLAHDEDMYLLNPGSAAQPRDGLAPSYAFIDLLADGGIFCTHVDLK
ncbi:MAG: metallophosphoesterase [Ruminococcus sp.]|nr:metallophosphoesterase [Ruminococcus sp.]MBR7008036.1 metallophosphoesterase [Ruminococcus sp.]